MTPAKRLLALALMLTVTGACSTGDREIETTRGPRAAESTGPLIILGLVSKATSTLRQSNAHKAFEEVITVNVPPGTEVIVPTVRGWAFGYGSTTPEDLSPLPDPNASNTWHPADHHVGLISLNIWVDTLNAVDPATNTQTAKIKVSAILSDDNGDDEWFGYANYTLLCLGKHP